MSVALERKSVSRPSIGSIRFVQVENHESLCGYSRQQTDGVEEHYLLDEICDVAMKMDLPARKL